MNEDDNNNNNDDEDEFAAMLIQRAANFFICSLKSTDLSARIKRDRSAACSNCCSLEVLVVGVTINQSNTFQVD